MKVISFLLLKLFLFEIFAAQTEFDSVDSSHKIETISAANQSSTEGVIVHIQQVE